MKMLLAPFFLIALAVAFSCSGGISGDVVYRPSDRPLEIRTTIEIDMSRDSAFDKLVAGFSSASFVAREMDKHNGAIVATYSGDPELYVDGGELTYRINSTEGKQAYTYPASRGDSHHQVFSNGEVWTRDRQLRLYAQMNVALTAISGVRTRVEVSTKYTLTMKITGHNAENKPLQPYEETLSFNGGQVAMMKGGIVWRATGGLEARIFDLLK